MPRLPLDDVLLNLPPAWDENKVFVSHFQKVLRSLFPEYMDVGMIYVEGDRMSCCIIPSFWLVKQMGKFK